MQFSAVSASNTAKVDLTVRFCSSRKNKDSAQAVISGAKAPSEVESILNSTSPERFKGAEDELLLLRQAGANTLLIGIGDERKLSSEEARRWSAAIWRCLQSEKLASVRIFPPKSLSAQNAVVGFTEGLILSSYQYTEFKEGSKHQVKNIEIAGEKSAATEKLGAHSRILAEAVNHCRRMGDAPGNIMTPTQLAKEAEAAAKGTSMKVTVWNGERIKKEKMDSFYGVSLGSSQEPKFIIMEYKGGGAKNKPLCLVGKGLTFDCGGISIKPGAGMEEMKYDMCGGAAVIAAMSAIAKMKLKINVIGLVPATENMPGPSANKPGDIRRARNGKSIEINNTDAEGRLILADALVYACEQKPAMILDTATLTGAMMIALGNTHTGFFTRDNNLRKKIEAAAEAAGERVWCLPLINDHAKDMKGTYADLTNLAPSRNAGSATAAAFLEAFVDKDIPWAHFDIAGTAWHVGGRLPYCPAKGASGVIVRTFVEMAKSFK